MRNRQRKSGGRNPFLPVGWHIPDGEAHVLSDGKLYLYGSCDQNEGQFCSTEYYVAATEDLCSWEMYGPSFDAGQISWPGVSRPHSSLSGVQSFDELPEHIRSYLPDEAKEIPIEQIVEAIERAAAQNVPVHRLLYAPDAIEKNGRYYLFFCCSDDSEGVAVSNHSTGPFQNPIRLAVSGIDPAVFVDDDGQAYYYWGQFCAHGAKLSPDMTSILEETIVYDLLTEKKHHFHEGSSVRKRGDTYYYVFTDVSRGKPTCLGYATSKSPLGPFTYQGVIIDNANCDPGSWNNHGCIEKFREQWYVFYHRSSRNSQYMRRACAERITFDENGLIPEVRMTSQGAGLPFVCGERIPGNMACEVSGGSYVVDKKDERSFVRIRKGGTATFRYIASERRIQKATLFGEPETPVRIWMNGRLAGKGNSAQAIDLNVEAGNYEVSIECEKDFFLYDFILFDSAENQ